VGVYTPVYVSNTLRTSVSSPRPFNPPPPATKVRAPHGFPHRPHPHPTRTPTPSITHHTGHVGVGSIVGLSNARVAQELGLGMVLVANGGLGSAFDELELNRQVPMSVCVCVCVCACVHTRTQCAKAAGRL
jgi:hypothetical protein